MAKIITVQGEETKATPANGKYFTLAELQKIVGGLIDILPLPSGKHIVINDEGKLDGLDPNAMATALWRQEYPIDKYPYNNDELVVGDVLVYEPGEMEADELAQEKDRKDQAF